MVVIKLQLLKYNTNGSSVTENTVHKKTLGSIMRLLDLPKEYFRKIFTCIKQL